MPTVGQEQTSPFSQVTLDFIPADRILRKDGFYITIPFLGTAGATAGNYGQVFTARHPMEILRVTAAWTTASTSGTLQVEILTGTTAPGSGSDVMSATISTAGAANTVVTRESTALTTSRQVLENQRIALKSTGTLTNLVGLHVTIYAKMLGRGDYR